MIYFLDPGFSSEHILSEYQKINSLDWRKEPDERDEDDDIDELDDDGDSSKWEGNGERFD